MVFGDKESLALFSLNSNQKAHAQGIQPGNADVNHNDHASHGALAHLRAS